MARPDSHIEAAYQILIAKVKMLKNDYLKVNHWVNDTYKGCVGFGLKYLMAIYGFAFAYGVNENIHMIFIGHAVVYRSLYEIQLGNYIVW